MARKSTIFSNFWALLPEPETTSLQATFGSSLSIRSFCRFGSKMSLLGKYILHRDGHLDQICKKVVVRFVKNSRFCLAEVTKRWPFESPEAANQLPFRTHERDVIPHRGIAVSGLSNGHLFVTSAKQNREIFTSRTTTFLQIWRKCPSLFSSVFHY